MMNHRASSVAVLILVIAGGGIVHAQNQTEALSPMLDGGAPFEVSIEQVEWGGEQFGSVHSASVGRSGSKVILVGGMSAGMHDFSCDPDENFPSSTFNHMIYVLDVEARTFDARSMDDGGTGLTEEQIAEIATINTLYEEDGGKLLVVGGYGMNASGDYVTFDSLRVMDVDGVAGWVDGDGSLLSDHITFHGPPENTPSDLADDFFTVCGGIMLKVDGDYWLCLGQDFQGGYTDGDCAPEYTQVYTKSIRRFRLNAQDPDASPEYISATADPPEWARRRDLNVLPARVPSGGVGGVALAGVFTDFAGGYPGIWTAPIVIENDGTMSMGDPADEGTLKQGFNCYNSGRLTLWSESRGENWFLILGGLGYQVLFKDHLIRDPTIPYSNGVLTVRYAPESGEWSQHLLDAAYPDIYSARGELYYHGTESLTIPMVGLHQGIYLLDEITEPTTIALIYGGILSVGQAIVTSGDTYASNLLFKVIVTPVSVCPGDLNDDGRVDGADLGVLLAYWGPVKSPGGEAADLNHDGIVDGEDLTILLGDWGPCD